MSREQRINIDLHHRSPDWARDRIYFVTLCATPRGTNQLCTSVADQLLQSIKHYHTENKWYCHLALLMPDHAHFLLSFDEHLDYPKVIGNWKRWTRTHHGIVWQENFFDHRVRNEEQFKIRLTTSCTIQFEAN